MTFGDNNKAIFGAGSDLQIWHDATNNSIIRDAGAGDLYIQASTNLRLTNVGGAETYAIFTENGAATLYYDNSAKIATSSSGISVTKAIFGAGSDLQIYHDGSNNRLNVTSGNLYVNLSDTSEFTVTGTQNTAFKVDVDSAVTLYNNGSPKLTTTSTGIDVTGTVTADGLTVDGTAVEVASINSTQNGAQINFDSASTSS
jgi:hypothetical protein